jgi:hypothetical protein
VLSGSPQARGTTPETLTEESVLEPRAHAEAPVLAKCRSVLIGNVFAPGCPILIVHGVAPQ